jgi:hypothetical protein
MSSSDGAFIVKFIAESAGNGMSAVDAAKQEIEEIDAYLQEAERKKLRRMKLTSVLDHFGDETYRRRRSTSTPTSDDIDVSSDDFTVLRDKIISAIAEKGPLTVRELILEVGSYDQDTLIMRAVKWLGDQEVVSRDEEGRVQRGKNW